MSFWDILAHSHVFYGTGNAFSRSLFSRNCFGESKKWYLLLESFGEAEEMAKLYRNLELWELQVVRNMLELAEAEIAEEWFFAIVTTTLSERKKLPYLFSRRSLRLSLWKNQDSNIANNSPIFTGNEGALALQLAEWGYTFDESLSEIYCFRREGDSVFIRKREHIYIASFFDGIFEGIKKITDGKVSTIDSLTVVDLLLKEIPLEFAKVSELLSLEWFANNDETPLVIIGADFWEYRKTLASAFSKRKNTHFFDFLPSDDGKDLEGEKVSLENPGELANILVIQENTITCYTKRPENLEKFRENNRVKVIFTKSSAGLESFSIANASGGRDFIIADDILSVIFTKNRMSADVAERIDLMLKMAPGDFVVHRDHGIAKFRGIVTKELPSGKREYLELEYAGDEKLFVPLSEVYRVGKYLGDANPKLHKLSGNEWKNSVKRAEQDAAKVAEELLDIYAKRTVAKRPPLTKHEEEELAFREAFPHTHTKDQARAIEEILSDLEKSEPMDRLLSGDVGFGKTEVAMNVAYRAILEGKQVAIVSPLVVLAYDHFESVSKRMESFGVRVAVLTRMTKPQDSKRIITGLGKGEIDIVIGTHRLLSSDIHFKNLGLLVVDEEHKFGVLDKERIAGLRANLDILSLSATPIPRSLHLSLSGIRASSVLTTPPFGKKPIRTEVSRWNPELVAKMLRNELARGGQALVVRNSIRALSSLQKELQELTPKGTRIASVHGRMHAEELEDTILAFKNGEYDILLATTVIENGVNFLGANTIIIDEADEFGLASLHQLRGRVGRKDQQAYCALLYRKDTLEDDAKKRLIAIASNSHLGAGFEIAMRDLEIRGAGEILWVAQSGKTKDTGISLYLKILSEKVSELRGGNTPSGSDVRIELDIPFSVPDTYFTSEIDKLHFFRSLESVRTLKELDETKASFLEERDELSAGTNRLFLLVRARLLLAPYKISTLRKAGKHYFFQFEEWISVEILRKFLSLTDTKLPKWHHGDAIFTGNGKIRIDSEAYENDVDFLEKIVYSLENLS